MNIKASFSIPIIVNNKLWGLISFHHRTPKYLSYGLRIGFELLSSFISQRITAKEIENESLIKSKLKDINIKILARILKENTFVKPLLTKSTNLLDLLNINGAAIKFENKL